MNSYWYSLFLWLFAGIMGPALVYGVRFSKRRKLLRNTDRVVSWIQRACYLALLVGILFIAAGLLGAMILDQSTGQFFFNQYVGAVIPSTLAGVALINYFESKTIRAQSEIVFVLAILFSLVGWLIFQQIFFINLVILIVSVLSLVAATLVEHHRRN